MAASVNVSQPFLAWEAAVCARTVSTAAGGVDEGWVG